MGWTPDNGAADRRDPGSADRKVDRRWLKRQVVLWRSLALVVLTVLATLLAVRFGHEGGTSLHTSPYIARIPILGVIQNDQERFALIDALADNDDVRAVIVQIDSPGGTFSGSEALYGALRRLAEAKPTVAVMGGIAASGGYMAAVATDRIFARAGSITGSVGVIMQMPRLKGLLDSLGVEMESVRSGPLKAPTPFEDSTAATRDAARSIVEDLFDQFLGMVMARRTLDAQSLAQVRSGRVFTGQQALPLGLVDAIGGETEAKAWLVAERSIDPDLGIFEVSIEDENEFIGRLMKRLGSNSLLGVQSLVDGPWAIWHYSF